jgi:methyl-accepting chemotaxis protein
VDSELIVSERMMEKLCAKVIDGLSRNVKTIIAEELSSYAREMGELRVSLGVVNKEFDELKIRLSNLNDEMKQSLNYLAEENRQLRERVVALEAKAKQQEATDNEVVCLKNKLRIFEKRENELRQESYGKNIEIMGLRYEEGENIHL